jgi:hypothetical protein
MVTSRMRCLFLTWPSLAISAGILIVYALGLIINDWRTIAAIGTLVPVITALSIALCIKESPVWLLEQERDEEAKKSLEWIRRVSCKMMPEEVQNEFQTLTKGSKKLQGRARKVSAGCGDGSREDLPLYQRAGKSYGTHEVAVARESHGSICRAIFSTLKRPDVWKPLVVLNCYFFFMEFSGIPVIISYAVNIMMSEGVAVEPYLATLIVGVVKLTFEVAAGFVQNRQACYNVNTWLRFQALTAASMKMTASWDVAPCSIVEVYRRFRNAYCLLHQGDPIMALYPRRLSY